MGGERGRKGDKRRRRRKPEEGKSAGYGGGNKRRAEEERGLEMKETRRKMGRGERRKRNE